MVLSRSDFFPKDEVEGEIVSVVMEDIVPYCVFVDGDTVKNIVLLGL